MPSSHSATVTYLAIAVGFHDDFGGSPFATALVLACVVMYDAFWCKVTCWSPCRDVKDIKCVINYDFPTSLEDYVHWIDRIGRAGAKGTAFTFFTLANAKFARELIKILQEAGQIVPASLSPLARSGGSNLGGGNFRSRGRDGYGNRPF